MRYIRLSTDGLRGLPRNLALAAMRKVRQQRPGEGQAMLTRPATDGTYYAAFGHVGQADLFISYLDRLTVDYTQMTELPAGLTIRPVPKRAAGKPIVVVLGSPEATQALRDLFSRGPRP